MAKPRKLESGRWIAQIQKDGKRLSKTFDSASEAKLWAAQQLVTPKQQSQSLMTFGEVCRRWLERYGEGRIKSYWESNRINYYKEDALFTTPLKDLSAKTVADWRDRRLKVNGGGTVLRDWNFFSSICTVAIKEMKLMERSPFSDARRPEPPPPRDRLPTEEEFKTLEHTAAGRKAFEMALLCFRFGCETGMSIGEIAALEWSQISNRIITLPPFKTRPARQVPMSSKAVELVGAVGVGSVFGAKAANVDVNWRKLCKMAAIEDLHFHDSRHYAATMLATKLQPLELAKMLGHRDLKMLLAVYYKADASALLDRLG